jgi:hypothetical protein
VGCGTVALELFAQPHLTRVAGQWQPMCLLPTDMRRTKKPRVNRKRSVKARADKTRRQKKREPDLGELRAPMTGEVEEQLRQLVQRFGVEKVRDALVPLIAECKFSDWQCVANALTRIARQQKRNARGLRV